MTTRGPKKKKDIAMPRSSPTADDKKAIDGAGGTQGEDGRGALINDFFSGRRWREKVEVGGL